MKKTGAFAAMAVAIACLAYAPSASSARPPASDGDVKKQIIAESISAYPGKCPCPYHAARNGSACGARSAWSRKGGYAPLCYEREISSEMVQKWRQDNRADRAGAKQE